MRSVAPRGRTLYAERSHCILLLKYFVSFFDNYEGNGCWLLRLFR